MNFNYVPTTCPYCGCGCGSNLVVQDGKLTGVEPWKRHPVSEGKLCPLGHACAEFAQRGSTHYASDQKAWQVRRG